jgi:uncharacterized protein
MSSSHPLPDLCRSLAAAGHVIFEVKVITRSSASGIVGLLEDGTIKIRLAAVPEKGKANEELRTLLAASFAVPKRNVTILAGETSTHKRIRIDKS